MIVLYIYLLICTIETVAIIWAIKTGRWEKLENKVMGDDAWKDRITHYLPENNPGLAAISLFLAFFMGNPIFLWTFIKNWFS